MINLKKIFITGAALLIAGSVFAAAGDWPQTVIDNQTNQAFTINYLLSVPTNTKLQLSSEQVNQLKGACVVYPWSSCPLKITAAGGIFALTTIYIDKKNGHFQSISEPHPQTGGQTFNVLGLVKDTPISNVTITNQ